MTGENREFEQLTKIPTFAYINGRPVTADGAQVPEADKIQSVRWQSVASDSILEIRCQHSHPFELIGDNARKFLSYYPGKTLNQLTDVPIIRWYTNRDGGYPVAVSPRN